MFFIGRYDVLHKRAMPANQMIVVQAGAVNAGREFAKAVFEKNICMK
jgi:hypothetical protein